MFIENRLKPRENHVTFRIKLSDGSELRTVALDASINSALFPTVLSEKLSRAKEGFFQLSDGFFKIDGVTWSDTWINRIGHPGFMLSYNSVRRRAAPNDREAAFLRLEMKTFWDRHEQLQNKNRNMQISVVKLFTFMLLYAATPFSLQGLANSEFLRVWGLGGVWLAVTAWFYCDRTFWSYGNHLFEQIFSTRQIAQIRKIMVGRFDLYSLYTLRPIMPGYNVSSFSGGPSHLSRRQIKYTAYFYKSVSIFLPLYLCLFLSLLLFPGAMTGAGIETAWIPYLRVNLGFGGAFLFWVWMSMERCYRLNKNAYCADWISVQNPWPRFPKENELDLPVGRRFTQEALKWLARITALANLSLFLWRYAKMPGQDYRAVRWWSIWDFVLLGVTVALILGWYVFDEFNIRYLLKRAEAYWYKQDPSTQTS